MPGASRLVSPILAGRDAELRRLDQALAEAVAGGTQRTVLLGAEAGGGKSRLILEFTARVRDRATVLGGRCAPELEAGLPYAPFTAALRDLVRSGGTAAIAALVADGATADLARILPEFGHPATGLEPEMARARLFEVARSVFEGLARSEPTVLVIEDAHWADGATRDLLSFLAGNLATSPLLLIVSYRTEELHRAHPLRPLLAELSRLDSVAELTLARLGRHDVATQLEGILGRPAPAATLDAVYQRGEGVPLFTEVLLDAHGGVRSALPGSLRDLILGVTRELPVETQSLLRAMAVGGVRVGHELLARVTQTDDAALASCLRPAVEGHVLLSDADGYSFRHALIRESVHHDLLSGEAAHLHRAYAEALEDAPSLAPDAWLSLALARHWHAARDPVRALRTAWYAAREAGSRLAYPEQLEMLELVLEHWPCVARAAELVGRDRTSVVELAADAACWAAEPERGLAHVEAALTELDADRDASRVAGMLLQRAVMRHQLLLPGELDDLHVALRLSPEPTRLRAETLGQLARALVRHGRPAEAKPLASELASLSMELHDEEYGIEAAIVAARLGASDGDAAAALHAAVDAARRLGSGRLEIIAYAALQEVLERRGEHARAVEAGTQAAVRTRRVGQARYMGATVAHHLARALVSVGRWDEALETLDEAFEMNPAPSGRAVLLQARISIATARGDRDLARRMLDELRALHQRAGIEPADEAAPAPALPSLGLTPREVAVLELVTAGRSNREIAAELFISPKTASVHVSNILAKLNVPTRGAAAATAHRLRLFEPG